MDFSTLHMANSAACPFSGLPVTSKPEWTDIPVAKNASVTFKLIGNAIVFTSPIGPVSDTSTQNSLKKRKEFLITNGLADKKYVEIRDYSLMKGKPTKKSRIMMSDALLKEATNKHLLGFWAFNTPLHVRMAFTVGKKLFKAPVPVDALKNYKDAVIEAVRILMLNNIIKESEYRGINPESHQNNDTETTYTASQIQEYSQDLLAFLGTINWDKSGITPGEINTTHPFRSVFEAVEIIKSDIDDLFMKQKKNKRKLQESESRYRTILESIDDGYYEVDLKGDFTFFNKSLCDICGYSEKELMGMNYSMVADVENRHKIFKIFNSAFREEKTTQKSFEWEFISKKGEIVYLEASVSLIRDKENAPKGFRGIVRDMHERRLAEKKQQESRIELEVLNTELEKAIERTNLMVAESAMAYLELDQIFKASTEGIWVIHSSFEIMRVNDTFLRIVDQTHENIKDKKCFNVFPNRLCHTPDCPLTRIMAGETAQIECDLDVEFTPGETKPYILSAFPFKDTIDETIGVVIALRDITERIKAEKLHEEKIKAEADTLAKSNFLANVSHEIRTPLNGIIGMTELIENTSLDEHQKNIFNTISNETKSLLTIISDVLDFSKIEAGKFGLEKTVFNLRDLIEDIADSLAIRAHQKGLDFISFIAPELPVNVKGDPGKLRQILMNLAGNALKFTHTGEIAIRIEASETKNGQLTLYCSVRDTGIGIPGESQEKIFECFTQADESTTRKYGGTGLGTAISKQLIELMGGEIGLKSIQGKGSTFWFTIKLCETSEPSESPESIIVPFQTKLRGLIVDNNKANREVITWYMESWGLISTEAGNEEEALSLYIESAETESPYDFILISHPLPETTGFELAEQLKGLYNSKTPPIVVITPVGWAGDGKICMDSPIEGCLTSPVKYEELKSEIKKATNNENNKLTPILQFNPIENKPVKINKNDIRILLVEDYPTNQQVALAHLCDAGYQVDLAENGEEAVSKFRHNAYNIVLMDIQMPVMGGFEATKAIRHIEASISENINRLPVIALTAHAMSGYEQVCIDAEMDDYLSKPLLRKSLLAMVEKWTGAVPQSKNPVAEYAIEPEAVDNNTEGAPMDYDKALEEFVGKKDVLTKVLNVFRQNVSRQIGRLRTAVSENNAELLKQEAHTLKGGAANLTAEKLSDLAHQLEVIGMSENLDTAGPVLDNFEKEFKRLEDYLNSL